MTPNSIGVNLRVTGHCSQGGRKYMEDFFSVAYQQTEDQKDLEYAFFGIYDGHGGSEAATFAKEHLMNSIVNQKLFWSDCDQDILRAIREGYIATHYAMWREQEKWPKTATGLPSTAGTTASVAFIRHGKIYIGHVGDSGIVLGYQEEGDKCWKAKPLTHDHKPECNVEKARIINSGGKVVTKSGVPRVVWNRPRIGHKGPVRRSTPIDEIPFLAVARSLGDLWSYNSALDQFVVSPDPDVLVVNIDPKTYRCLIFGTDGLWNVLSPSDAVELARDAEIINKKLTYMDGSSSDWTNPSKCLVDKALDKWCSKKMRADNTSVVTIMLDPPEIIENNSTASSYGLEYIQFDELMNDPIETVYSESFIQNYPVLDNSTVALFEETSTTTPAVISEHHHIDNYTTTSLENNSNNCDNNISPDRLITESIIDPLQFHTYHSLDESGIIGQDHIIVHHQQSNNNQQEQHQYQQQCMSAEEGYSLTKLETRCHETRDDIIEIIGKVSTELNNHQEQQQQQQSQQTSFQELNNEENQSYNQYDNITSSYQQTTIPLSSTTNNPNKYYNNNRESTSDSEVTPSNSVIQQNKYVKNNENKEEKIEIDKNYSYTSIDDDSLMEIEEDDSNNSKKNQLLDESIQINEISSSVIEPMILSCIEENEILSNSNIQVETVYVIETNECDTEKTPTTRITRRSIKQSQDQIIEKANTSRTKTTTNNNNRKAILIEQNENISIPRKLRSTVNCNKRILRSREILAKDIKSKLINKNKSPQQQQQQTKRNLNNYLKVSNSTVISSSASKHQNTMSIRTRQFQQQQQIQQEQKQQITTVWSPRQKRTKNSTSTIIRRTAADSSLKSILKNKPKTLSSSSDLGNLSSSSVSSSSPSPSSLIIVSSSTQSISKRSSLTTSSSSSLLNSKNNNNNSSAWCSNKSAVQTRNRVQKRLSH